MQRASCAACNRHISCKLHMGKQRCVDKQAAGRTQHVCGGLNMVHLPWAERESVVRSALTAIACLQILHSLEQV